MAHEMGHYIACVWYNVDATLPFFLPSPVPLDRHVWSVYPYSFSLSLPGRFCLTSGLRAAGRIRFPGPRAIHWTLRFPQVFPASTRGRRSNSACHSSSGWPITLCSAKFPWGMSICIPWRRAAWFGMLATAINLLPAGQLDGGHIVYALFGRAHKWVTYGFLGALIVMGRYWGGVVALGQA